jgi:hypothetical protein
MKTANYCPTLLLLLLLLSACKHEPMTIMPSPNPHIHFDDLQVGQSSKYLCLKGFGYGYIGSSFSYLDDTLELKLVAENSNGFLVQEKLFYNGEVAPAFNYYKDSTLQYYIQVFNDTLRFKPVGPSPYLRSMIFEFFISRQGLPIKNFTQPQLKMRSWHTSLPGVAARKTGYIENYPLFGVNYPHLNVVIENTAMALDGNGETMMYHYHDGIIRASTYSSWTSSGYGWDLLPEQ